jgi:putative transcriptional regulator
MSALMHHPSEDTLLAYAAGTLDEAASILVATHLALCPDCRDVVAVAEAVGGELMDAMTVPAKVTTTFDDVMLMVSGTKTSADTTEVRSDIRLDPAANSNQADLLLPQPLRHYVPGGAEALTWRWMGPGVRYASIFAADDGAKVGLMRIASGTRMPHHGHSDEEFTMVLAGGYRDRFGSYRRGDVETAGADTLHQPVADDDGDCICLVVTRGELKPTGLFARMLQPLMRM